MLIAKEKKRTNIAEYILYMWQLEDIVRASNLDIAHIQSHIIDKYEVSDSEKAEIKAWYENLMDTIKLEHLEKQGHTMSIKNTLDDLQQFHNELIKQNDQAIYSASFYRAFPHIQALNTKTNKASGEIELCFNALYGVMILRLKGQEISKETQASIAEISTLIRQLSKLYHEALEN